MTATYIAYADKDSDHLMAMHEALRKSDVPSVFATTGEGFTPKAAGQLDGASVMVVLVSAAAMRSNRVRDELAYATARQLTIIPYQLDKAKLTGTWRNLLADKLRYNRFDEDSLPQLISEAKTRYHARCPVIAVMNMKGGVGKTTVTSQVFGAYQAQLAGRVLLIDLDPQYNLTQVFFDMDTADANALHDASVISLFEKSRVHGAPKSPADEWEKLSTAPFAPAAPEELMQELLLGGPAGRLDLICGQFEICKYGFSTDAEGLAAVRKNFLSMVDHYRRFYDLIVIDTNPNASFLTDCCVRASDHVLIPMQPDMYSMRGVKLLRRIIQNNQKTTHLHTLFNRVNRSERSEFEAEARNGALDSLAGFGFAETILDPALPYSRHYITPSPREETPAWRQLLTHYGRGGGLKIARNNLLTVAEAIAARISS